ncbi:hypothetical protein OHD62_21555 [Mesorhizobium sp. YC-39]|uniref:hypothetical protein n=1 Tax=unclassified Mesorhizobium TaxID=325217 RepID=UPI0021E7AE1F|nr:MULTISPECIES: hypothetical protein [unclassified Mesorhizobium]MCV3210730.1 hypothetical protein [Mesorhizobium sp. YC-2]MCV3230964.1 hypothetical protein [Mesorhizobium sp. YC-39]
MSRSNARLTRTLGRPALASTICGVIDGKTGAGEEIARLLVLDAHANVSAGADELAVFTSASETFASRNINCTIAESLDRFVPVIRLARSHGIPVRGYVSCAVDCPYEGEITPDAVAMVSSQLMDLGCHEISVADTIGRGLPERVGVMLERVLHRVPASMVACHFHDTSGRVRANVDVALDLGIATFDSSAGGLGGCPYAPGAAGNIGTGVISCFDLHDKYAHNVYIHGHCYDFAKRVAVDNSEGSFNTIDHDIRPRPWRAEPYGTIREYF